MGSILWPPNVFFNLFDNQWRGPDNPFILMGTQTFISKQDLGEQPKSAKLERKDLVERERTTVNKSTGDRLKELKELKDAGVLTEEEYETKRKALVENL